jgi:hypothetical protein
VTFRIIAYSAGCARCFYLASPPILPFGSLRSKSEPRQLGPSPCTPQGLRGASPQFRETRWPRQLAPRRSSTWATKSAYFSIPRLPIRGSAYRRSWRLWRWAGCTRQFVWTTVCCVNRGFHTTAVTKISCAVLLRARLLSRFTSSLRVNEPCRRGRSP